MPNLFLVLWDLAVALGVFGWGAASLRLVGFKRAPLALSGVFGISLWIALGGWLNLLHLLRPGIFFVMAGAGILLGLYELWLTRRHPARVRVSAVPLSLVGKLVLGGSIAVLGFLLLGSLNPRAWNGDDTQGYAALAIKAAQMHSIQPDPFCERRVQAGVGGATFLDAMMYATGDMRAMTFIDGVFGLLLYALALWAIGRLWDISPGRIGFVLLCLPLATLIQLNTTIIYLSAAAFLVVLYLLSAAELADGFAPGRVIVLGMIGGGLCCTKSPNIVFLIPLLAVTAALALVFRARVKVLLPLAGMLLISIAVVVPYAIANKTNAGTFLYPLLGLGFHVNAYHLIRPASAVGSLAELAIVLTPSVIFLLLSILIVRKLTSRWAVWPRLAIQAYLIAALLAVFVTAYGTGGEATDRYTAPFVMPSLLLVLLIVLGAFASAPRRWVWSGMLVLAMAGSYIFFFIGIELGWYSTYDVIAHQIVNRLPVHLAPWLVPTNRVQIELEKARAARIQAALPPHAVAIEAIQTPYSFDFRRDTIYLADFPGLASPPPGIPLQGTPADLRRFLLDHRIHYVMVDNRLKKTDDVLHSHMFPLPWQDFLRQQKVSIDWRAYLRHPTSPHLYGPWGRVEMYIAIHERNQMYQIASTSPQVYNDGTIIVARLQ